MPRSRPAPTSSGVWPRPRRRTMPVPTSRAAPEARARRRLTSPTNHPRDSLATATTVLVEEERVASRLPLISVGWAIRDYVKRVWDNSDEDNVLFLAGGIAFNILLAIVPFVLLLVWFLTYLLNKTSAETNDVVINYLDKLLPAHEETAVSPYHKLLTDILGTHPRLGIWSAVGFIWFSTPLFRSLPTVLASVFDIEDDRSTIACKIFAMHR